VQLDEPLRDGEAEPAAALLAGAGAVDLLSETATRNDPSATRASIDT
jgi:hypothetical protein